jgi:mono/diheme cytochrome c family protein
VARPVLAWLGILAVVAVLVAAAVIYSGVFNVAATVQDSAALRWLLITTREASIRFHAKDIEAYAPSGADRLLNGFRFFREECAMCHTPPGRPATAMSKGLNPEAPSLVELAEDDGMTDAELFWVTRNGIRFTGMPAWATSRSPDDIWDVVAFIRSSPDAANYDALDVQAPLGGPAK